MGSESYTYFDHDADIGIAGHGDSVEAAFESAAAAMFAIMVDLHALTPKIEITLAFDETDVEFALVTWLNMLIAEACEKEIVLGKFRITQQDGHWQGQAWGEPWRDDLERGVEVKGATLTMLAVKHDKEKWEARCVVDV